MSEEAKRFEDFLLHSRQYFDNAQAALGKNEYAKTGELLWGSAALMVKAYALAITNHLITHHAEFFNYVGQLAEEVGDQALYESFATLDGAHRNFYNLDNDEPYIRRAVEITRSFLGKMVELLKAKNIQAKIFE